MRGEREHVGAERRHVDGDAPGRLRGVAMEKRAVRMRNLGRARHGLDRTGLVVREHDGDKCRRRTARQHGREGVQVEDSLARHRDTPDVVGRVENRDVLNSARQNGARADAAQGQIVRLGAAGGEHDTLG